MTTSDDRSPDPLEADTSGEKTAADPSIDKVVPEPVPGTPTPAAAPNLQPAAIPAPQPQLNTRRLFLRIAACFVTAVVVVAILFVTGVLTGKDKSPTTTTTTSRSSGAVAVRTAEDYATVYSEIRLLEQNPHYLPGGILPMETDDDEADPAGEIPQRPDLAARPEANPGGQSADANANNPVYSTTNTQVRNIDEGDIIKTDGHFIYTLGTVSYQYSQATVLSIFSVKGADTELLSRTFIQAPPDTYNDDEQRYPYTAIYYSEMFLVGDTIVLISSADEISGEPDFNVKSDTQVELYDVSDRTNPKRVWDYSQSGSYYQGRLIDGRLYVLSNYFLSQPVDEDDPVSFVPLFRSGGDVWLCAPDRIGIMPVVNTMSYAVLGSIDVSSHQATEQVSVLGGCDTMYMSYDNLYICSSLYDEQQGEPYQDGVYTVTEYKTAVYTQITRVSIADGALVIAAQGVIDGSMLSQFSLDEYHENLRMAVTIRHYDYNIYVDEDRGFVNYEAIDSAEDNSVYVLSPELNAIGELSGLGRDEIIYSVRFAGDMAYVVTFRQTDPLFAIDLSDPTSPKLLSELKLPGFSTYMHPWEDGLLIGFGHSADADGNVEGLKLSMFDVSDPTAVTEVAEMSIDVWYSEALYEHKAFFVMPEHNLIGFPDSEGRYRVYSYEGGDGGFVLRAELMLGFEREHRQQQQDALYYGFYPVRAVYVDGSLYVFSETHLDVFDCESFELVCSVRIVDLP